MLILIRLSLVSFLCITLTHLGKTLFRPNEAIRIGRQMNIPCANRRSGTPLNISVDVIVNRASHSPSFDPLAFSASVLNTWKSVKFKLFFSDRSTTDCVLKIVPQNLEFWVIMKCGRHPLSTACTIRLTISFCLSKRAHINVFSGWDFAVKMMFPCRRLQSEKRCSIFNAHSIPGSLLRKPHYGFDSGSYPTIVILYRSASSSTFGFSSMMVLPGSRMRAEA
jgi:hypothetical protein